MAALVKRLRTHAAFLVLLSIYICAALAHIGFLAGFVGDENAYRTAVWDLFRGGPAHNLEHPVLAKTLQAFGAAPFALLGGDPLIGMRVVSVLAGAVALVATYAIGVSFGSVNGLVAAAALLVCNTLFLVHARLISPEMTAVALLTVGLYFWVANPRGIALAGAFLGLSLSAKWIGVWLAPWILARLLFGKEWKPAAKFLAALILFYAIGNAAYLMNHSFAEFIRWPFSMLHYHRIAATGSPENASSAWTWFLIPQHLYYARLPDGADAARMVMAAMNPVVFLLAIPSLLWALRPDSPAWSRMLAEAVLCLYVPWLLVSRPTYFFYVLPVLPPLALLEASLLMSLFEQGRIRRILAVGLTVLAGGFFGLFCPAALGFRAPERYERLLAQFNYLRRPVHNSMFCQNCNAYFDKGIDAKCLTH